MILKNFIYFKCALNTNNKKHNQQDIKNIISEYKKNNDINFFFTQIVDYFANNKKNLQNKITKNETSIIEVEKIKKENLKTLEIIQNSEKEINDIIFNLIKNNQQQENQIIDAKDYIELIQKQNNEEKTQIQKNLHQIENKIIKIDIVPFTQNATILLNQLNLIKKNNQQDEIYRQLIKITLLSIINKIKKVFFLHSVFVLNAAQTPKHNTITFNKNQIIILANIVKKIISENKKYIESDQHTRTLIESIGFTLNKNNSKIFTTQVMNANETYIDKLIVYNEESSIINIFIVILDICKETKNYELFNEVLYHMFLCIQNLITWYKSPDHHIIYQSFIEDINIQLNQLNNEEKTIESEIKEFLKNNHPNNTDNNNDENSENNSDDNSEDSSDNNLSIEKYTNINTITEQEMENFNAFIKQHINQQFIQKLSIIFNIIPEICDDIKIPQTTLIQFIRTNCILTNVETNIIKSYNQKLQILEQMQQQKEQQQLTKIQQDIFSDNFQTNMFCSYNQKLHILAQTQQQKEQQQLIKTQQEIFSDTFQINMFFYIEDFISKLYNKIQTIQKINLSPTSANFLKLFNTKNKKRQITPQININKEIEKNEKRYIMPSIDAYNNQQLFEIYGQYYNIPMQQELLLKFQTYKQIEDQLSEKINQTINKVLDNIFQNTIFNMRKFGKDINDRICLEYINIRYKDLINKRPNGPLYEKLSKYNKQTEDVLDGFMEIIDIDEQKLDPSFTQEEESTKLIKNYQSLEDKNQEQLNNLFLFNNKQKIDKNQEQLDNLFNNKQKIKELLNQKKKPENFDINQEQLANFVNNNKKKLFHLLQMNKKQIDSLNDTKKQKPITIQENELSNVGIGINNEKRIEQRIGIKIDAEHFFLKNIRNHFRSRLKDDSFFITKTKITSNVLRYVISFHIKQFFLNEIQEEIKDTPLQLIITNEYIDKYIAENMDKHIDQIVSNMLVVNTSDSMLNILHARRYVPYNKFVTNIFKSSISFCSGMTHLDDIIFDSIAPIEKERILEIHEEIKNKTNFELFKFIKNIPQSEALDAPHTLLLSFITKYRKKLKGNFIDLNKLDAIPCTNQISLQSFGETINQIIKEEDAKKISIITDMDIDMENDTLELFGVFDMYLSPFEDNIIENKYTKEPQKPAQQTPYIGCIPIAETQRPKLYQLAKDKFVGCVINEMILAINNLNKTKDETMYDIMEIDCLAQTIENLQSKKETIIQKYIDTFSIKNFKTNIEKIKNCDYLFKIPKNKLKIVEYITYFTMNRSILAEEFDKQFRNKTNTIKQYELMTKLFYSSFKKIILENRDYLYDTIYEYLDKNNKETNSQEIFQKNKQLFNVFMEEHEAFIQNMENLRDIINFPTIQINPSLIRSLDFLIQNTRNVDDNTLKEIVKINDVINLLKETIAPNFFELQSYLQKEEICAVNKKCLFSYNNFIPFLTYATDIDQKNKIYNIEDFLNKSFQEIMICVYKEHFNVLDILNKSKQDIKIILNNFSNSINNMAEQYLELNIINSNIFVNLYQSNFHMFFIANSLIKFNYMNENYLILTKNKSKIDDAMNETSQLITCFIKEILNSMANILKITKLEKIKLKNNRNNKDIILSQFNYIFHIFKQLKNQNALFLSIYSKVLTEIINNNKIKALFKEDIKFTSMFFSVIINQTKEIKQPIEEIKLKQENLINNMIKELEIDIKIKENNNIITDVENDNQVMSMLQSIKNDFQK